MYIMLVEGCLAVISSKQNLENYLRGLSEQEVKILHGIMYEGRKFVESNGRNAAVSKLNMFKDPESDILKKADEHADFTKQNMIWNIINKSEDSLRLYLDKGRRLFDLGSIQIQF